MGSENAKRQDAQVVTFNEYEDYKRGGGKGSSPDKSSLWDVFNDKVSDVTLSMRNKARETVRQGMFAMDKKGLPADSPPYGLYKKQFNDIVNGGVKGALVAAKVLAKHSL